MFYSIIALVLGSCLSTEFKCARPDPEICIPGTKVKNGIRDCPDSSDEGKC